MDTVSRYGERGNTWSVAVTDNLNSVTKSETYFRLVAANLFVKKILFANCP